MVSLNKQVALFIILSFALIGCGRRVLEDKPRDITVPLCDGDIAFRRGYGVASEAVIMTNNRGSYSHVGVVVNYNGEWCVAHAVPYESDNRSDDRVYCQPIGEFFSSVKAQCGAIYRMDIDSVQLSAIELFVMSHVEAQTPFDHKYTLGDEEKLYCSELVWCAYNRAGIDLTDGRRTTVTIPPFDGVHIMPADIELNDNLKLVYSF
ncbi:MAG: YiiX/YebB-like N1pC/P60 family cysteine hydrolase [Rikenellaceae bacterium]